MKECREEYARIRKELEKAKDNHDESSICRLSKELQDLSEAVARDIDPKGKTQKIGNRLKKHLNRVSRAINRSIESIHKKDDTLARHFCNSLKTGCICTYSPEAPITWNS